MYTGLQIHKPCSRKVFVVWYCAKKNKTKKTSFALIMVCVSIQLWSPYYLWMALTVEKRLELSFSSTIWSLNNKKMTYLFFSFISLRLAFSKSLPPSNKVLNVPRICPSDQPGVKGHQELPFPLSQETSSRKAKGEQVEGRAKWRGRREVIFKKTTMTRDAWN